MELDADTSNVSDCNLVKGTTKDISLSAFFILFCFMLYLKMSNWYDDWLSLQKHCLGWQN